MSKSKIRYLATDKAGHYIDDLNLFDPKVVQFFETVVSLREKFSQAGSDPVAGDVRKAFREAEKAAGLRYLTRVTSLGDMGMTHVSIPKVLGNIDLSGHFKDIVAELEKNTRPSYDGFMDSGEQSAARGDYYAKLHSIKADIAEKLGIER